jgi:hypothetical protein
MHITHSLAKIIGYQVTSGIPHPVQFYDADEAMITPTCGQSLMMLDDLIFHAHVKGTQSNAYWLSLHEIPVLVTVRNIFDVMYSLKEKSDKGIRIPGVPSPVPWKAHSEDMRWSWVAHNAVPWNLQFYATWARCGLDTRFCVYEKFYADQVAGMNNILDWLGLEAPQEKIRYWLETDKTNLNVGGSGRGVEGVPDFAKKIVYDQIDAWGEPFKTHMLRDLT